MRRLHAAPILVAAAAAGLVFSGCSRATLEFRVQDAVSNRWVWDATAKLQDREIHLFYQSDAGTVTQRFTGLKPGRWTLEVSAPYYQAVSLPVMLRAGRNSLPSPVVMQGLEIPSLAGFFAFESLDKGDIVAELRPIGADGKAVLNHPCIPLWVGCRLSVQTFGGKPAREATESGAARGVELYAGRIDWAWDPAPGANFHYYARIPAARAKAEASPLRVIDYLFVVPIAGRIGAEELETLMARVWKAGDPDSLMAALKAEEGRVLYFTDTSWNVKAVP